MYVILHFGKKYGHKCYWVIMKSVSNKYLFEFIFYFQYMVSQLDGILMHFGEKTFFFFSAVAWQRGGELHHYLRKLNILG